MTGNIRSEVLEDCYLSPKLPLHIASALTMLYALHWFATFSYAKIFEYTPSFNSLFLNYFVSSVLLASILLHLFYVPLYYFDIPFFRQYRVNTVSWPWEQDPAGWPQRLKNTVKTYMLNQLILGPLFIYLVFPLLKIDFSLNFPSFSVLLFQIFVSTCLEDFFFYFSHRLLHLPFFYKRIHKIHHEFNNPFHLSSVYTHWVEFIIGNMVPLIGGAMALGRHMHITTFIVFVEFRLAESNEAHSGFSFPWSPFKILPFSIDSSFHNYHHVKNIGNYATFFFFWDWYFGTCETFIKNVNPGYLKLTSK